MIYRTLKQRILYYLVLCLILSLIGKIFFMNNECKKATTLAPHKHEHDPWNINEHHIEHEVYKAINKIRRTSDRGLKPIGVPEIDEDSTRKDVFELVDDKLSTKNKDWGPHQIGIIVPFRNRFEELKEFVPYMHDYLNEKKINHKIYVINQVDSHRFNRAMLINIGFKLARNESCDYIAMHDVDLMPVNKDLNYGYPELGPFHVSGPNLHPKYHYKKFVGGILLLNIEHFLDLNGLSNKFWGWGREDDEFYMRIVDKGYKIFRHGAEITTGYDTFKHFHGTERKRDYLQLPGQRKSMFSRDMMTGLDTLEYTLVKRQFLYIDGSLCSVIDVDLPCDVAITPWCDVPVKKKKQ